MELGLSVICFDITESSLLWSDSIKTIAMMLFVLCRCGHRLDEPPVKVTYQAGARARSGNWHVCKAHSPDNATLPAYKGRGVLDIFNLKCLVLFSGDKGKFLEWEAAIGGDCGQKGYRCLDPWGEKER